MKHLTALLAALLFTTACATTQELSPRSDLRPIPAGTDDDCQAACVNGRRLRCVFAENTPEGGTCEAMCHNSETSGYVSMRPACMAKATSCEQADDCSNQ